MSSMMAWRAVLLSMSLVGSAACNEITGVGRLDFDGDPAAAAGGGGEPDPSAGEGGGAGEGDGGAGGNTSGAGGTPFCVASPADDFDGDTLAEHWEPLNGVPPGAPQDGELVFELSDPEPGQHTSVISKARYDLTGCHIAIEVVSGFNTGSNAYAHVSAVTEDAQYIEMGFSGTQLDIKLGTGPAPPILTWVDYDPTAPLFVAFGESDGRLTWETSQDGYEWTVQHAEDSTTSVSALRLVIGAGTIDAAPTEPPGVARFDHLNVLP